MNYLKSFFKSEEKKEEYNWISGLILFSDEDKMKVDRGFIITGDISNYPFYCQFKNFTTVNGDLYYIYPNCMKKINPDKIYLHLRIGTSPYPVESENKKYWHLFFTSPQNKIYKSIELEDYKIKIHDFPNIGKINIENIKNPLFLKRQIYDKNSILFSSLKIYDL